PDGSNIAPAWMPSGEVGRQYDIDMNCTMNNGRLLTDSQMQVTQAYYNVLPITTGCKNFEWSNGSPYK
ncbi:hypothetical protein, partial [Lactococcus lactis]|uniref:hypothetical protein n=1 Tax=Lactococcus lactis TaxID=1358 RepID=UPI001F1DF10C